jgi:Ser/Thr protein kinase RdoA (MazF antagonist)
MTRARTQQAAVGAAMAVAERLGAEVSDPVVLRESNHISVRLGSLAIVARVVPIAGDSQVVARLARELSVAQHLVRRAAPVVSPSTELPAGPHVHGEFGLTLWQFVEHARADEDDADDIAAAAAALRHVHQCLADFSAELPSFRAKIEGCRALLEDRSALPALAPADRDFLLAAYSRLDADLASLSIEMVPIHGDAHLDNVFMTPHGARWTDLESACRGPREWDIGFLPAAGLSAFAPVDRDIHAVLSGLRSLCVSVWCWDKYDSPEKQAPAQYHLRFLKERFA